MTPHLLARPVTSLTLLSLALLATAALTPDLQAHDISQATATITAQPAHSFFYENTPIVTQDRHRTTLHVGVLDDPATQQVLYVPPFQEGIVSCKVDYANPLRFSDWSLYSVSAATICVTADATTAQPAEIVLPVSAQPHIAGTVRLEGPDGAADITFPAGCGGAEFIAAQINGALGRTGVVAVVADNGDLHLRTRQVGSQRVIGLTRLAGAIFATNCDLARGTDATVTGVDGSLTGVSVDGYTVKVENEELRIPALVLKPGAHGDIRLTVNRLAQANQPQSYGVRVIDANPSRLQPLNGESHFTSMAIRRAIPLPDADTVTINYGGPRAASRAMLFLDSNDKAYANANNIATINGKVLLCGNKGMARLDFGCVDGSRPASAIAELINAQTAATGVRAVASEGNLIIVSEDYGSAAFVAVALQPGAVFNTTLGDDTGIVTTYDEGSDLRVAGVDSRSGDNGQGVTVDGLTITVDRPDLQAVIVMAQTAAADAANTTACFTLCRGENGQWIACGLVGDVATAGVSAKRGILRIHSNFGEHPAARKAALRLSTADIAMACGKVDIVGAQGEAMVDLGPPCTFSPDQICSMINLLSGTTAVVASLSDGCLELQSVDCGSHQFVAIRPRAGAVFSTTDMENRATLLDFGVDTPVVAVDTGHGPCMDGVAVDGLTIRIRRPELDADLVMRPDDRSGVIDLDVIGDSAPSPDFRVEPTADPLAWTLISGRRGAARPGVIPLNVEVTAYPSGIRSVCQAQVVLRRLGDVNGDGFADGTDKLQINRRLNSIPTIYTIRELDLTGDGRADATDKLQINRILNTIPIP